MRLSKKSRMRFKKMSSVYFILKDAVVDSANASTSYLTNAFPLSSILGMGEAFCFQLSHNESLESDMESSHVEAFAIIKDYQLNEGKKAFPAFHKEAGAAHKSTTPSEIMLSENTCNFKATLVFKLDFERGADIEDELEPLWLNFLMRCRVAGGKLTNLKDLKNNASVVEDEDDLETELKAEKGWVVSDESELFDSLTQEHGVKEAIRQFVFTYIENDKELGKVYRRKQKGFYYLDLKGYQLLEEPIKRKGSRFDKPHAFAEPVITGRKLNYFRLPDTQGLFWRWQNNGNAIELVKAS